MRYAVFSDIHANLEALEALLAALQDKQIDQYRVLGDLINYGADPKAVVDRVFSLTSECIMGKQEAALFDVHTANLLNPVAQLSLKWTKEQLTSDQLHRLSLLPLVKEEEKVIWTHASPLNPQGFPFILSQNEAQNIFASFTQGVCFVGHTHIATLFMQGAKEAQLLKPGKISLKHNRKTIVNVGSVGQPRDWDLRACCVIFDDSDYSIEVLRVEYDRESAARKIREAHLPDSLAEHLIASA